MEKYTSDEEQRKVPIRYKTKNSILNGWRTYIENEYDKKYKNLINTKNWRNDTMETKSRYETISELEAQKRSLIRERDGFKDNIKRKEREIKQLKRDLEDAEESLNEFKESVEERKTTIAELIKSVDDSLERMSSLSQKK